MTLDDHGMEDATPTNIGADNRREIIVPILRSGALAREFCRSGGPANVDAVFERSFYLRRGADFICVGEPSIGNGPLTLIAPTGFLSNFELRAGRSGFVSDQDITVGKAVRFTMHRCEPWVPLPWPITRLSGQLIATCLALSRRVAISAPQEGFGRIVFGAQERLTSLPALARTARTQIAAFECWLSTALDSKHASAAPVRGLIGLGVGLTPSGDDFLVGALALLDALGERHAHAALARSIIDVALELTSPLSACFLRTAAAGHIGEHLHCAISSVIAGDVEAAIVAVETIGHSSGWDILTGIATTLKIVAARSATAVCMQAIQNQ